jgi:ketosteroid isomerase-like protein
MKKSILAALFLLPVATCLAQDPPETAIRKVLTDQVAAWNNGDIDNYMKGYWHNDSLAFVGHTITYGYDSTLLRYKTVYNGPDKMGKLFFTLLRIERLSPDHYFVIGKWFLKRKAGDIGGMYTLLFRRIDGQWLIVADHSSN